MATHLIFGGSGSGKSKLAETLLAASGDGTAKRYYIATMAPHDDEARSRIARHREARTGKGFATLEAYTRLDRLEFGGKPSILLECLGNLLANEMFSPEGAGPDAENAVLRGIKNIERQAGDLLVVSNDVFSDGCAYSEETDRFCRALARIHQELARSFDRVTETVCGLAICHKEPSGPEPGAE